LTRDNPGEGKNPNTPALGPSGEKEYSDKAQKLQGITSGALELRRIMGGKRLSDKTIDYSLDRSKRDTCLAKKTATKNPRVPDQEKNQGRRVFPVKESRQRVAQQENRPNETDRKSSGRPEGIPPARKPVRPRKKNLTEWERAVGIKLGELTSYTKHIENADRHERTTVFTLQAGGGGSDGEIGTAEPYASKSGVGDFSGVNASSIKERKKGYDLSCWGAI